MLTRNRRNESAAPSLRTVGAVAVFMALALTATPRAKAGSLTPPGSPAPTMLSIDTAEPRQPISAIPFTIASGGSYFLTKSLTLPGAGNAITVTTTEPVTIDLNGFTLKGTRLAGTTGIVYSGLTVTAVTIKNGTIRNFESGAALQIGNSRTRFEDVTVESNLNVGAFVWDASVSRSQFLGNGQYGLLVNGTGIVADSRAGNNGWWGFYLGGPRSIITNCLAELNGPGTSDGGGIVLGPGGTARGNNVVQNHGHGIAIYDHALVVGNHISQSDINGIMTLGGGGSRIEGNSVDSNSIGIVSTSGGNIVIRNSGSGNASSAFFVTGTGNVAPVEFGAAANPNSNISY